MVMKNVFAIKAHNKVPSKVQPLFQEKGQKLQVTATTTTKLRTGTKLTCDIDKVKVIPQIQYQENI